MRASAVVVSSVNPSARAALEAAPGLRSTNGITASAVAVSMGRGRVGCGAAAAWWWRLVAAIQRVENPDCDEIPLRDAAAIVSSSNFFIAAEGLPSVSRPTFAAYRR